MRGLEKNRMGRGQTDTHRDTRTCRLLDQLGPVGENYSIDYTGVCRAVPVSPGLLITMIFTESAPRPFQSVVTCRLVGPFCY